MEVMASLGLRIRRAREAMGMSQGDLGNAVKRSVRAVNDWENDRHIPRSSIGLLEKVLGADLTGGSAVAPWAREDELETELRTLEQRINEIEAELAEIRARRRGAPDDRKQTGTGQPR